MPDPFGDEERATAVTGLRTHPRRGHGVLADRDNVREGNPIQVLVSQRMRDLGDGHPLSLTAVVARAGYRNGRPRIAKATLSNLLRGATIKLRPDTVTALAVALELDRATVDAAVRQARERLTIRVPDRLRDLSPEGWSRFVAYGDYLLHEERHDGRTRNW
jgi:hypothetical protein